MSVDNFHQQSLDDVLALEQMLEQGWWTDNTGYLRPPHRSNIVITGSKYRTIYYKTKQFMVPQMYSSSQQPDPIGGICNQK